MKGIRVAILGTVILLWGISPLWAQFDMRNPNNPYAGMGRTGYALEERDKKLQQDKEARKAKEQAAKQNKQTTTTTPPAKQQKK
jgi:hypothetical protein